MMELKTYTKEELAEIQAKHRLWRDTAGAEGERADLSGADLSGADLSGAYLSRADLSGADLSRAYLSDADLSGADLSRADLSGAYLSRAYLSRADLSGADLSGARGLDAGATAKPLYEDSDVPVIPQLNTQILKAVDGEAAVGKLEMSDVHRCDTTHCVAGWAVHLAGESGYALEQKIGWRWAGAAIFRKSTGQVPHFFASNARALKDLRSRAAKEAEVANG
jgi:uncharacterized protein YjbI with pentapeptide repeats